MKIFKYIALLFLFLIATFFAIGIFTPSFTYQNKVTVNAPVEKVFMLFTDTAKMKEWLPGFISITNDSGIPYSIGSKWNLVLVQEDQRYEMTETMMAFKVNKQYSYQLDNAVLRNQVDIYFKPDGNKTEITAHNFVTGNSIIWRSIFFFYEKEFYRQGQETYVNLKKIIESQH